MSSFNGSDYDLLFSIGHDLYTNNFNRAKVRQHAVTLMAMCESVRGQQAGWPNISKRYRHLTEYPSITDVPTVVPFPKRKNSK